MASILYAVSGALVLTALASWRSPADDAGPRAAATYAILAIVAACTGWCTP